MTEEVADPGWGLLLLHFCTENFPFRHITIFTDSQLRLHCPEESSSRKSVWNMIVSCFPHWGKMPDTENLKDERGLLSLLFLEVQSMVG